MGGQDEEGELREVGREMDALVAEKVMGWKRGDWLKKWPDGSKQEHFDVWIAPELKLLHDTPMFSTNITAAWEVVEQFIPFVELECNEFDSGFGWICKLWLVSSEVSEFGETAPEAICRAALKAMGL